MLKINKYSKKCIENIKQVYKINNFHHELFKIFDDVYSETIKIDNDIKILNKKLLKKLHNYKQYPLIYLNYLETNKENSNQLNFKEFYNYYTENFKEIPDLIEKESRIKEIILNPMKDRKKLHKNIYTNQFISIDIQQIVETNNIQFTEILLNNNKISIYEIDKKVNLELIYFIINFMENLAKKFNIKHNSIDLTLLLTSQKKLITNEKFLGPENINSGSTYFNESVFIWRIEEVYKVLIHELIHFFGFDYKLFMETIATNHSNKHCIDGEDRENEAYTESFAILIHTFIISKFLKISFFDLFNYEINFSLYQCKKILDFFQITDIKDIIFNKTCKNPIYQKTAVFSYFFIKTSLILNLKDTMDFICKNNKNISEFNKLIEKSLESEVINIINNIQIPKENNFFNNTMRMTCVEFS